MRQWYVPYCLLGISPYDLEDWDHKTTLLATMLLRTNNQKHHYVRDIHWNNLRMLRVKGTDGPRNRGLLR